MSALRWLLLTVFLTPGCKTNQDQHKSDHDHLLALKRLEVLPQFSILLSSKARASLEKEPKEWVRATFVYRGQTYGDVGVRIKGHRSLRNLSDKPALKIGFDKYNPLQRFLGLRSLTLNNLVDDPTMLREVLGYRLYRELQVPAPAAFYARLNIDGLDRGLYAVIETVDRDFLAERFVDASGSLFEGDYGCDLYPGDIEGFDQDSGAKNKTRDDLRRLVSATEAPTKTLFDPVHSPLDMPAFLAFLAVSAFIGDFDGYRHAHNYRIYHEPTVDKWYLMPWGIDRAFKNRLSIYESYGRLARLCFADASCRAQYVRRLRQVTQEFVSLKLEEGASALAAHIEPVIRSSEMHRASAKNINKARNELLTFLRERPNDIAKETACMKNDGAELDADGDGYGCLDCNDSQTSIHPGAEERCDGIDNDCSGQVDDNPECPSCAPLFVEDQSFVLCNLPRSWTEAASYCQEMSGSLANLTSPKANQAVAEAADKLAKGGWWLGLNDREREGEFQWPTKLATTFNQFERGEPDNSTCNQDCVVINSRKAGKWRDTHCGQPLPFVCSVPKGYVPKHARPVD